MCISFDLIHFIEVLIYVLSKLWKSISPGYEVL